MKYGFGFAIICSLVLIAATASAQPFALVNAGRDTYGVGVGSTFGQGNVQPGFLVDVFHAYSMEHVRPDTEAYGELSVTLSPDWYSAYFLGAGATFKGEPVDVLWSARAFLLLTQTKPVAFRTSSFVMWTPTEASWFIEQRFGPSLKLAQTEHRLFPYLALDITTPGVQHRADVGVTPGCTLILNF